MDGSKNTKPPAAGGPSRAGISKPGRANHTDISLCLEDFRAFILAEHGPDLVGELRADGEFHGIGTTDDKHGAKPFRYCVHTDPPQNIYFNDLKRGISGTWFPEGRAPLTFAERELRRLEFERGRVKRQMEAMDRHAKAAKRAQALWRSSFIASPAHAYLARKGVGVHGVRYLPAWARRIHADDGSFETVTVKYVLLVPMKDENGTIWNVQAIFPETCPELGRDKDFLPGGRKKGLFHWIGERTETVCLAEGYATAATIHEATGYRVVVCFDAGNMPFVAQTVRGMLPSARIVICADNDAPDRNGRRAGQDKAHEAAYLVGGFVAMPPVEGADFNDWALDLRDNGHGG